MSTDLILPNDSSTEENEISQPTTEKKEEEHKEGKKEKISFRSLFLFALIIVLIVLPIRLFIAKPFIVSGTSMLPTFNTWNYLIIDQLTYRFSSPKRGDVIVFRPPRNPSQFYIKRIIALPNETLKLSGTKVTIFNTQHKNGFTLNEPYVLPQNQKDTTMTITLPNNEYFVMGDNRKVSYDSRYWGPLTRNKIIGRVYVRLFPFNEVAALPGAATYSPRNTSNAL